METSLTRLLGIEHPIIQAPIGGLSVPALAGAVSNAGGLGMMAITCDAPHRTLRNTTIDEWLAAGSPPRGMRPGEGEVLATRPDGTEVVRYASVSARASLVGRIDDLSLWCGQGVALVREVLPAAEIVRRTVADAEDVLAELGAEGVVAR